MKTVLVTGAKGFIGKNLIVVLKRRAEVDVIEHDLDSPAGLLEEGLAKADVIYHLAGVNRPERVEEFTEGNFDLTRQVCDALRRLGRTPLLVLSSSTQAALDNPYGLSKRQAEDAVFDFGRETGASVFVFRLHWCLRQMVPAQLQFRGGHILSQHRPQSAHRHLRSGKRN